jgi:hypothetical protein
MTLTTSYIMCFIFYASDVPKQNEANNYTCLVGFFLVDVFFVKLKVFHVMPNETTILLIQTYRIMQTYPVEQ